MTIWRPVSRRTRRYMRKIQNLRSLKKYSALWWYQSRTPHGAFGIIVSTSNESTTKWKFGFQLKDFKANNKNCFWTDSKCIKCDSEYGVQITQPTSKTVLTNKVLTVNGSLNSSHHLFTNPNDDLALDIVAFIWLIKLSLESIKIPRSTKEFTNFNLEPIRL